MSSTTHSRPTVAVILVNWNGWRDTQACLETLLPTLQKGDQVLVCDNASTDGSLNHLITWANSCDLQPNYVCLSKSQAEDGGKIDDPQLILIETGSNLGFAGGNNVGIRYALTRHHQYIWLLNNDTIVSASSATALIECMMLNPKIGMCGSTIYYHDQPNKVQCLGGSSFNFDTACGNPIGYGLLPHEWPSLSEVNSKLSYVSGASMMVSREMLEKIGLMNENYFLYFEEIDWAIRAENHFQLAWAPKSVVWHKEGGSIGSSHRSRPSNLSLRLLCRNRLRFTREYKPKHLKALKRHMWFETLVYAKRLDWVAITIYIRALLLE